MTKLVAWLGGGLFVASLALTIWWYFVRFGDPPPEGGGMAAFGTNALLLTIFACHHSVFAREAVKRRLTFVPAAMMRSFYVWLASGLLILVLLLWQPIGGELYQIRGAPAILNAAVQAVGIGLIARAVSG